MSHIVKELRKAAEHDQREDGFAYILLRAAADEIATLRQDQTHHFQFFSSRFRLPRGHSLSGLGVASACAAESYRSFRDLQS